MDTEKKPRVAIVATVHIKPSEEWVNALWNEAKDSGAHVIIVDDSDGNVELPWSHDSGGDVYDYEAQRLALGVELYTLFEQFHQSSACKNFGTWKAYQEGYDVIIVIDSDCIVPNGFVKEHLRALEQKGRGWDNPLSNTSLYSRGFPYSKRELPILAHMGLWTNCLDLYGTDRVGKPFPLPDETPWMDYHVASGHFPLSGMNVAFTREAIPYMLFLPNFESGRNKFRRHDDIWGGYIFEKIVSQKGGALSYGLPYVKHDSIVVAEEDAEEEKAMIKFEDAFYEAIDTALVFTGSGCSAHSGPEIFMWLSQELGAHETFGNLRNAFKFWSLAFK